MARPRSPSKYFLYRSGTPRFPSRPALCCSKAERGKGNSVGHQVPDLSFSNLGGLSNLTTHRCGPIS